MGIKVKTTSDGKKIFKCPGCNGFHSLPVSGGGHPCWSFNGDHEKPTFSPSILTRHWSNGRINPPDICHSFVNEGKIQFLDDCTHSLRGEIVEIPDWPYAPDTFGGLKEDNGNHG